MKDLYFIFLLIYNYLLSSLLTFVFNSSSKALLKSLPITLFFATFSSLGASEYAITSTNKMTIRRKNGVIYMKVNDEEFTTGKDHSSITTFDTPVTFGCSLTSANAPQRYYKGTLKNMKVIIFE